MFLILFCFQGIAQEQEINLIPNASFEEQIPFEEIGRNHPWNKCLKDDTPDYFRFFSSGGNSPVFREFIGGPPPVDGSAYVGIFCYRFHPVRGIDDVREFIQVELSQPLIKDSTYILTLHTALDPESTHACET